MMRGQQPIRFSASACEAFRQWITLVPQEVLQ